MDVLNVETGDGQRLKLEGALVVADVASLKARILDALKAGGPVVLDLGAVEECDTAGIQLLVASTRPASRDRPGVRIGPCSDAVRTTAARLGIRLMTTDEKEA